MKRASPLTQACRSQDEEWAVNILRSMRYSKWNLFLARVFGRKVVGAEQPVAKDISGAVEHLSRFVKRDAFWEQQPYGTRFYYGNGGLDYIQRGLLESIIDAAPQSAASTNRDK